MKIIKSKLNLISLIVIFVISNKILSQENLTARQIIEKSNNSTKLIGYESISTLKIINKKGVERIRKNSMASKTYDNGNTEKRIVKFQSPAELKGTGILIFDYKDKNDNMWIYMPELSKTRRIISE